MRLLTVPRLKVAGDCVGSSRGRSGQGFVIMKGAKAHPSIMSFSEISVCSSVKWVHDTFLQNHLPMNSNEFQVK